MRLHFEDEDFDGQLQRGVSYAPYGLADLGEAMATAERIASEDRDSWYSEWFATGELARTAAEESRGDGHRESARLAFLRASNWFRMAEFYVRDSDEDGRSTRAFRAAQDAFAAALQLFTTPAEAVRIPYEDRTLPGYVFAPDDSGGPHPTLIAFGGQDALIGELWGAVVAAALARGYAVVAFDGPGQGEVLRVDGVAFRPDWEAVVTPAVDFAVARPEVDPGRLATIGRSFGGYLAPRAVSGEPRIAALVADPGQFDFGEPAAAQVPEELRAKVLAGDPSVDPVLDQVLSHPQRGFFLKARMRAFGVTHVREMIGAMQGYTLRDVAGQIRCPTLVCDNEHDPIGGGQARQLYDALPGPRKDYVRFTGAEGAAGHCEGMAQTVFHRRAFDWLDGVLRTG